MRVFLLIAAAGVVVLTACQQTMTAPSGGTASATAAAGTTPPADSQLMNGAQNRLNRYGFGDVDANTLTRDQVIRLNSINTFRKSPAEIRQRISAILARTE